MDGEGSNVTACFMELNRVGPMFGYYPEVKKSIIHNLPVTWKHQQRYLDGHIGLKAVETYIVVHKVRDWVHKVNTLLRIAV